MNVKEKKCYFERYFELNKTIKRKILDLERLRSSAEKSTTVLSWLPHGESDRSDIYIKIVELDKEINETIDLFADMRADIEEKISTVQDKTLHDLLTERYINCLKWEQVADKIGRTTPMTKIKLHERALNAVNII